MTQLLTLTTTQKFPPQLRRGNWSDSEAERLCRAVHKFAKSKGAHAFGADLLQEANNQGWKLLSCS